ncbi:MAG: hypothetical protein K8L91_10475 [Anaerolineae bacterium]|nr:hypothetical protein [Anaerolineae bacterium]
MHKITLNGAWSLFKKGDGTPIPATVPGCVHTDLLANGLLEDPFYRTNELSQMWIGETDWRYTRSFVVSADILAHDRVLLRFHGLDTLATVRVNGIELGRAENMFRSWEFDIKSVLRVGENLLEVDLAAPMPYMRWMDAEKGAMAGWVEPMRISTGAWLRKEPCNFGWDWGPKMVTSGIWRDVEIVAYNTARLQDLSILQNHVPNQVTLNLQATVEGVDTKSLSIKVGVSFKGKRVAQSEAVTQEDNTAQLTLPIAEPELWFPHNMGAQPLYDLEVTLYDQPGNVLDTQTRRIGLRTLTLERHHDAWGESFYFACNGVPFFAKGANWIPASPYPGQTSPAEYERLIRAAVDANMNMLRVWGGGFYESDIFYDLCDQYGITVWQDFMFACGTYPSRDEAFVANVMAEVQENVRRIRHHACIALWCGNNEIEQGLSHPDWLTAMSWEEYSHLFDTLIGDQVRELAPQTAYWPGSPHSPYGDRSDHMNPAWGDTHLWSVWHGKEPFEWYRTRLDRFCSEFGFQSFPEPATVYEFTLPEDRNITSYVMEHHQRSGIGNSTIIHYLLDWFRLPTSFEKTLWLSQILQGMAMKYAVEHWRRNMPRTMGTLYWQLNDMWGAPSWSSLDWKENWKALHYMARNFYAPLLISGLENNQTQTVEIHVTSDLGETTQGTARYQVTTAAGQSLLQGELAVTINPCSTQCIEVIDLTSYVDEYSPRNLLVWLELRVGNEKVSENLVTISRPKHLELATPHIQQEIHLNSDTEGQVTLRSDVAALYVWLDLPGAKFSDNFFHLRPNQPRTVQLTLDTPLQEETLYQNLRVYSLVDTYA